MKMRLGLVFLEWQLILNKEEREQENRLYKLVNSLSFNSFKQKEFSCLLIFIILMLWKSLKNKVMYKLTILSKILIQVQQAPEFQLYIWIY